MSAKRADGWAMIHFAPKLDGRPRALDRARPAARVQHGERSDGDAWRKAGEKKRELEREREREGGGEG